MHFAPIGNRRIRAVAYATRNPAKKKIQTWDRKGRNKKNFIATKLITRKERIGTFWGGIGEKTGKKIGVTLFKGVF